ncbi:MAG: response regulator [Elusimicrobia bacterium]|nr:response regulator [Candidatus Liberimonas magnetica]
MAIKVLVVDDEPEMLEFIKTGLDLLGYEVLVTSSALEAIALTHKIKPDIVILDFIMPSIDGYSIFRGLSASRITKDIPVIFITGNITKPQIMEKISSLNASDCLLKPFEIKTLSNSIKNALLTKQTKAQSDHLADQSA